MICFFDGEFLMEDVQYGPDEMVWDSVSKQLAHSNWTGLKIRKIGTLT